MGSFCMAPGTQRHDSSCKTCWPHFSWNTCQLHVQALGGQAFHATATVQTERPGAFFAPKLPRQRNLLADPHQHGQVKQSKVGRTRHYCITSSR
eukprot:790067-Pyramimonas_sp.AAC.1